MSPRVGIILHPLQPFCAPAQLLWRHFLLQSDRVSRHRGRDTLWGHACQPWTPLPIVMVDKDKYTETKANTKIPRQIHKVPKGLTSFAFLEITILQNFMISLLYVFLECTNTLQLFIRNANVNMNQILLKIQGSSVSCLPTFGGCSHKCFSSC